MKLSEIQIKMQITDKDGKVLVETIHNYSDDIDSLADEDQAFHLHRGLQTAKEYIIHKLKATALLHSGLTRAIGGTK